MNGMQSSGMLRILFRAFLSDPLENVVPGVGVEPTRLSSVDFESTASANSATRARIAQNVGPAFAVSMQNSTEGF